MQKNHLSKFDKFQEDIVKTIPTEHCIPNTIRLTGSADIEHLPEGSIGFILSNSYEKVQKIENYCKKQDFHSLNEILKNINEKIKTVSPEIISKKSTEIKSFSNVSYNNTIISSGLYVYPELFDIAFSVHPFNGGKLDDKKFTVSTFSNIHTEEKIYSLVIIRTPKLSFFESNIVNHVPIQSSEVHIGKGDINANTWIIASAIFVAGAVYFAAANYFMDKARDNVREQQQQQERDVADNNHDNNANDNANDHANEGGRNRFWENVLNELIISKALNINDTAAALLKVRTETLLNNQGL